MLKETRSIKWNRFVLSLLLSALAMALLFYLLPARAETALQVLSEKAQDKDKTIPADYAEVPACTQEKSSVATHSRFDQASFYPKGLETKVGDVWLQETNLLRNWSFEESIPDPDNWQMESREGDPFPILFWSSGVAHHGEHSAGIIDLSANERSGWVSEYVRIIQENEQLEFSGWVNAAFLPGKAYAYINLAFFDEDQDRLEGMDVSSQPLNGPSDWTRLSGEAVAPEDAVYVRVECYLVGSGFVFFDEMSLSRVSTARPILHLVKDDTPDPVHAGELLIYRISYSNTGQVAATNVFVTDTFDTAVTPLNSMPTPYSSEDTQWVWNIGSVPAEAEGEIMVTVTVKSPLTPNLTLSNQVEMSSQEQQIITDLETTQVIALPKLEIEKRDYPDPVEAGGMLTYTLIYSNSGSAPASGVVVYDKFDSRVTPSEYTHTSYAWVPPMAIWSIGDLGVGERETIVCSTRVTNTVLPGTVLQNMAGIMDDQAEQDKVYVTTQVTGSLEYQLLLEPKEQSGSALPGSSVVYTFTVTNYGSRDDHVNPEIVSLNHWNAITHVVKPNLSPLESTPLFITVTVPSDARSDSYDPMTLIAHSLESTADDSAAITTTAEHSACITISPDYEVSVPFSYAEGHTVAFTHTLSNCGNGTDTVTVTVTSGSPSWLKLSRSSFTVTVPAWDSEFVVITAKIQRLPEEGESPTYLNVLAVSGVDDSEYDSAVDQIEVQPCDTYLPFVMKSIVVSPTPPLENGDFETCNPDPDGWQARGPVQVVSPGECFSSCSARLGYPGKLEEKDIPTEKPVLSQQVYIPADSEFLEFDYCILTYDREKYDYLAVTIDNTVVWKKGSTEPTDCTIERKIGPKLASIPLTAYTDTEVTLRFWLEQDGSCNSWAYIDNVEITP